MKDLHVLIGRLGKDSEMRYTPGGDPVVNFTIAVDVVERGEKKTTWYNVSYFGKTAEKVAQYLTKGKQVQVIGANQTIYAYDKADGTKGFSLQLKATDVTLLGDRQAEQTEQAERAADIPF